MILKVVLHLGVHKTGSSYLQKVFFPEINDVHYILRNETLNFKNYILYEDDFLFSAEKARRLITKHIEDGNRTIVISDEEFYANPYQSASNKQRNIERLLSVFSQDDLKILIFLRDPKALLNSLYLQYVKTGGTASPKDFINYKRFPLCVSDSYFIFDSYIKFLIENCSADNLLVVDYEYFVRNKSECLQYIAKFIGSVQKFTINDVSVNASITQASAKRMRIFNHFTRSEKNPFALLPLVWHKLFRRVFVTFSKYSSTKKEIYTSLDFWPRIGESQKKIEKLKFLFPKVFLD